MEKLRYSEDVKESIHYAGKLARKEDREVAGDQDYLRGLLMTHRMFNRLDGLFKELGVSVSALQKALKNAPAHDPQPQRETVPPSIESGYATSSALPADFGKDAVHNAEAIARQEKSQNVEVEHLLKALSYSSDPVVREIVEKNHLTPTRIDKSLERMERSSFSRNTLFVTKELAEVVLFVLIFLILIKSFIGELRLIPSESMVPTLRVEDRVVIERVTRWFRPYQRGDILVFYPPMTELKNDPMSLFLRLTGFSGLVYKKEDYLDVAYIKRLIGLPGDTIEVKPNQGVYVNGELLDEPYVREIAASCTMVAPPHCGPITVPPGKYFFMGDNRNQSADSRYWGFEDDHRIIGRAVYLIWPVNHMGPIKPAPYQK